MTAVALHEGTPLASGIVHAIDRDSHHSASKNLEDISIWSIEAAAGRFLDHKNFCVQPSDATRNRVARLCSLRAAATAFHVCTHTEEGC